MRPKSVVKEEAIVNIALQIISEEGLENLSMQKLAQAANISPRTIYLKYENKEDLLIKLFIDEVLGAYEKAILTGFDEGMEFAEGIKKLWQNGFQYMKNNRYAFSLMQYGKTSPLLNKAYAERNIQQGQFFAPIHRFLKMQVKNGIVKSLPFEVQRALLFAPFYDLMNEYFEHLDRPKQIITDKVLRDTCEAVISGLLKQS
ncbi:TetR/AcrR family transcriptional regulator [Taibaiella soli]|uniref:TetR/AcrR family transcriptional regulator n=1 Tax=Taibaiella soli TaxID=1649169 RepID=A0A2W2AAU1_9BACT|nr:TetR/AcrR family transcriptional regulator [Taibaiella soli]PZF72505.1 TetR/AcrR family transcriptional regulator [Taibaiella soli]